MTTLVKLCLVLTVVLGLASASPPPAMQKAKFFRSLDTGDRLVGRCKERDRDCSQDHECCSNRCQLKCQKVPGGKCYRKCADCKHRNDICRTNGDCCSQQCAPDRFDPSKYICTDEESWDRHAQESPLEDEGETVSLASRSASGPRTTEERKDKCVPDGHRCTRGGDKCCSFRLGVKCHYDDPFQGLSLQGYCKTHRCAGLFEKCSEHQPYCCQGLTCDTGYCMNLSERSGPTKAAGEMYPDPDEIPEDVKEPSLLFRSGPKNSPAEESPIVEEDDAMTGPKNSQAEESPIVEEDDAMTGAPSAKETLGKLLKAVFKRLLSGKGIKMTVDVKNPEAVIDSLAE